MGVAFNSKQIKIENFIAFGQVWKEFGRCKVDSTKLHVRDVPFTLIIDVEGTL